jgi:hypothetical protein
MAQRKPAEDKRPQRQKFIDAAREHGRFRERGDFPARLARGRTVVAAEDQEGGEKA